MPDKTIEGRLKALRAELKKRGLSGFVIPLTDEHQSEYVADYAQRLAWISNFTGSAGSAVVTRDKAAIFVDGRYTIQVKQQVDPALFEICPVPATSPLKWLEKNTAKGDVIGFDPFLHTIGWEEEGKTRLERTGAKLKAVEDNPVDAVWTDQPGEPNTPVVPHDIKYAGKCHGEKRAEIAKTLKDKGARAAVISQLDSIAWLFNIRSRDVKRTPVSLAFATLSDDGTASLFIDESKVTNKLRSHLGNQVAIREKDEFLEGLAELAGQAGVVLADPASASAAIFKTLEKAGARIVKAMDPCAIPKAKKNPVELNGTRAAHIRDGAAVARFLKWIEEEGEKPGMDEMKAQQKLFELRNENGDLKDLSFDTISAFGPNGAICHYKLTEASNLAFKPGSLYLVDSGGQYLDGTTDITRTVPIGKVGDEEKDRYTRVLKGHIALATAKFPKGTTGPELDSFARRPLWDIGLDYDHGTGHGVGVYLAVHEGPGRIAKVQNTVQLEPGMIYSNEPGYYKAGEYGIRIENLVVVKELEMKGEQDMLGFETITFCPLSRELIKKDLLDSDEIAWVDEYHRQVRGKLGPLMKGEDKTWLNQATDRL